MSYMPVFDVRHTDITGFVNCNKLRLKDAKIDFGLSIAFFSEYFISDRRLWRKNNEL